MAPPHDMSSLKRRREQARQRRLRARVDVAAGVGIALFAIVVTAGLAIVGIVALVLLAACLISVALERRWLRRPRRRAPGGSSQRPRRARPTTPERQRPRAGDGDRAQLR